MSFREETRKRRIIWIVELYHYFDLKLVKLCGIWSYTKKYVKIPVSPTFFVKSGQI